MKRELMIMRDFYPARNRRFRTLRRNMSLTDVPSKISRMQDNHEINGRYNMWLDPYHVTGAFTNHESLCEHLDNL